MFQAKGRMPASDVTYVGGFYFRPSFSNAKTVIIGHVATPFTKTNDSSVSRSRQFTVPTNFFTEEYPLSMFDNMSITDMKRHNFFSGMNTSEQTGLGLIIHTAREFRRKCESMSSGDLENHEHMALVEKVKAMLEQADRESHEFAQRKADAMSQQFQALLKMCEQRKGAIKEWDKEFKEELTGSRIDPMATFGDAIQPARAAPRPATKEPVPAPITFEQVVATGSRAEHRLPQMLTSLSSENTAALTLARKTPEYDKHDKHDKHDTQRGGTLDSLKCLESLFGNAISPSRAFTGMTPTEGWLVSPSTISLLNCFDQPGAGEHEHVGVLPVEPVLS